MEEISLFDENWQVVAGLLPSNWRSLAEETGAISRRLRSFPSVDSIMRTLLLHIAKGFSLRETAVRAKMAGIADVSDVALLKRLRCSEHWLQALCYDLFNEARESSSLDTHGIKMRIVDGSSVKEPGKTGSLWRIHYSLSLPELCCDHFELTSAKGKGTGETFTRYPVRENECILGDRGYSTNNGICYLERHKAFSIVRVNTSALVLRTSNDNKFELLSHVKQLNDVKEAREWDVMVNNEDSTQMVAGRICAIRKSEYAAAEAIKKIKKEAARRQSQPRKETLEYAKYIIVFTTLPKNKFKVDNVLEWYRVRWQVELAFKRLKSLAGLGYLPKYDDTSSKAWLYGKLLVGLLTEKLIRCASEFSPWGYEL